MVYHIYINIYWQLSFRLVTSFFAFAYFNSTTSMYSFVYEHAHSHYPLLLISNIIASKKICICSDHLLHCYIDLFFCGVNTWWRHQMETFSALLTICAGNSPVSGRFPTQRPVTRSFDVFFDLSPNKRLSKQSWGWWLETPSLSLWRHCYVCTSLCSHQCILGY